MASILAARIKTIIEFSSHLQEFLTGPPSSYESTFAELSNYLAILPLTRSEISQQQRAQIRKHAVSLWNSCNKCGVSSSVDASIEQYISRVKAFAFLLLESVVRRILTESFHEDDVPHKSNGNFTMLPAHVKHFLVGNEAARCCLKVGQLEDAAKIVELLAKRYGEVLVREGSNMNVAAQQNELVSEFICLRIAAEWKRGRLDLAAHQNLRFNSLIKKSLPHQLPLAMAEKWLDLVYDIGVEELSQHRYANATTWLRTAKDFFDVAPESSGNADLGDIRLNILHAYARSLFGDEDTEAGVEAMKVVELLQRDYGDKLPVMLLQLELLSKDSKSDPNVFFAVLISVVRSVHLVDSNHKLIIFYIHQLCELSREHALRALQQYIILRLVNQTNNNWTECAIIMFLWMTVTSEDLEQNCDSKYLLLFLGSVSDAWKDQLSAEAARAGLILLWKQIDKLSLQTPDQGVLWCMVGLHQIFKNAGEDHLGKIERKMISYHHSLQDYESAQNTISGMSSARKAHHLSRYLAYCTYLKLSDEQQAQSMLSAIVALPNPDNKLLFACVGETMKHGSKLQSARLLQRLLDKYSNAAPPEVNVPALLRCTTKLLFSVANESQAYRDEILARLCHVLKAAVSYSTSGTTSGKASKVTLAYEDCRWFEQHSFNTVVKHLKDWPAKYVIDILQHSSQIYLPLDADTKNPEVSHKKRKHELTIAFIQAILYADEARSFQQSWTIETLPRTSFSSRAKPGANGIRYILYKNVFDRYCQIMQAYERRDKSYTRTEIEDLHAHVCTTLPLGFEALLYMNGHVDNPENKSKAFDIISLVQIVDEAVKIEAPPKVYALLADLILSATTQGQLHEGHKAAQNSIPKQPTISLAQATKLLSKIVQAVRNLEVYDINQAARWIRCIVQLIVDDSSTSTDNKISGADTFFNAATNVTSILLKSIIDQAIMLASPVAGTAAASNNQHHSMDCDGDIDMVHRHAGNSDKNYKSTVYPPEELEYLATILFNMAIDFYVAGNEDQTRWYAGKAIDVADVLALPYSDGGDKGMLANVLRQKTGSLGWVL